MVAETPAGKGRRYDGRHSGARAPTKPSHLALQALIIRAYAGMVRLNERLSLTSQW
jgi:hypothetical protein